MHLSRVRLCGVHLNPPPSQIIRHSIFLALFLLFCRLNFGLPLRRRHSLGSVRWCVGFAYSYRVRNAPANITALTTTRSSLSLSLSLPPTLSTSLVPDLPTPVSSGSLPNGAPTMVALAHPVLHFSTTVARSGAARGGPREGWWVGAATVEQGEAISFRSRFRRYRHGCC